MVQVEVPGQKEAAALLSALNPILNAQDSSVVTRVVSTIREVAAPPKVVGAALYVFSKLVLSNEQASTLFREVVHSLVSDGTLPRDVLYESIDVETHQLIEPNVDHAQEERRVRTRMWFTQTRFNLFREESEGYSKLMALLWDCVSAYTETDPNTVIESLHALIGQFNLDSNRAIEIVLSAAAEVVSDLSAKAGFGPKDLRLPHLFARLLDEFARDHVFSVIGAMLQSYHAVPAAAEKSESEGVGTKQAPSVPGDGLKSSTVAEPEAKTPQGIFILMVVLIRERRMAISDIWHNLSPRNNSEIATQFLQYEENLRELKKYVTSTSVSRPANRQNLGIFERSGTGASERDVFSQYTFIGAGPLATFSCQKIEFILTLLNMGRWDDAMEAILSLDVNGEHIDIASHPLVSATMTGFADALINPVLCNLFPDNYVKNTGLMEAIKKLGGRENRYPYPVVSVDDLLSTTKNSPGLVVRQMLKVLGPHARRNPALLHSLCRLLKGRHEPEAIAIMKEVVLPSFSLLQSNLGLGNAIWSVIREWSHNERWEIYGYLHNETSSTCAVYQVVADRAAYEMKYILKRLTTENHKKYMKPITKITHGQAIPAFSAALDRIQGYPPDTVTISPVVDACRECSELAVDMLLYLIIDRMADSKRRRLKEDGINIAQWYSTLSLFLGLCLRKLHVTSEQIEGVLSFLYTKLIIDREALLITALSDVIKCVADIEIESNLTAKQIDAQGGGHHLRSAVAGIWGRMQPDVKMVGGAFDHKLEREKKGAMRAMLGAFERTEMHVQIAIAIAQLSRESVHQEDLRTMPLKLGANIIDRAKSSLLQLSQFMDNAVANSTRDEEVRTGVWEPIRILGVSRMINEMGVSTSSAMSFLSPVLDYLEDSSKIAELQKSSAGKGTPPPDKKREEAPKGEEKKKPAETQDAGRSDAPAVRTSDTDVNMSPEKRLNSSLKHQTAGNGVLIDHKEHWSLSVLDFAKAVSERSQKLVSSEFIRAFWTLKLDDIAVPLDLYSSEIKRLNNIKVTWESEVDRNRRHTHADSDRRRRGELELKRIRDFIDFLSKEKESYSRKQSKVRQNLRESGKEFCPLVQQETEDLADKVVYAFLQECILPRCKVSISDAIFCSRFVLLLLELDIPVFSYSRYFECFLKLIPIALSSCTENEALSIARLVRESLTTLERWRSNRKVFEDEASKTKKHGFRDALKQDSGPLRHEQYCQWLYNIHENLTQGLCLVLVSEEYLYSRNSLCVLAGIADVFPKVSEHAQKIEEHVGKLCASDMPDIKLSSTGVLARLKSGRAKRLPTRVFMLKPTASGSAVASTSVAKRPADGRQNIKKDSDKVATAVGKTDATPKPPVETGVAKSEGVPLTNESQNVSEPTGKEESKKKNLNPNAKEFTPPVKGSSGLAKGTGVPETNIPQRKNAIPSSTGKRGRELAGGSDDALPGEGSRYNQVPKDQSKNQPPPSKRSRNAEGHTSPSQSRHPSDAQRNEIVKTRDVNNGSNSQQPKTGEKRENQPVPISDQTKNIGRQKEIPVVNARYTASRSEYSRGTNDHREDSYRKSFQENQNPGERESSRDPQARQTTRVANPSNAVGREAPHKALPRLDATGTGQSLEKPSMRDGEARQNLATEPGFKRNEGRDHMNRAVENRDAKDRGSSNRGTTARQGNERGGPAHADSTRNVPGHSAENRERQHSDVAKRNEHGRGNPGPEDRKDASAKDTYHRGATRRGGSMRDSPGGNVQRMGPNRETGPVDTNGSGAKDAGRRRKIDEPSGAYQAHQGPTEAKPERGELFNTGHNVKREREFAGSGDAQGVKREREYATSGEAYGVKREREVVQPRNTYSYEGGERRPIRQRADDGSYRERAGPREDAGKMNHGRRYTGPKSPSRDNSRHDGSFPMHMPATNPGWADAGRGRSNLDVNPEGRGSGGQGSRRRDGEYDHNPGWKTRAPERGPEFSGRDRPPSRPRDEGRRDGDYGYDDRMRPYRDGRRNGNRDERRRDRNYQGRNQGGRGGGNRQRRPG